MPSLVELSADGCRRRLGSLSVGRVGFDAGSGPRIYPVNYAVHPGGVVFRTAEDSELVGLADRGGPPAGRVVVFEVDHIDHDRRQGWSVQLVGVLGRVTEAADLLRIVSLWSPRPWADGDRAVLLKIEGAELTGRRIGDDEAWDDESADESAGRHTTCPPDGTRPDRAP